MALAAMLILDTNALSAFAEGDPGIASVLADRPNWRFPRSFSANTCTGFGAPASAGAMRVGLRKAAMLSPSSRSVLHGGPLRRHSSGTARCRPADSHQRRLDRRPRARVSLATAHARPPLRQSTACASVPGPERPPSDPDRYTRKGSDNGQSQWFRAPSAYRGPYQGLRSAAFGRVRATRRVSQFHLRLLQPRGRRARLRSHRGPHHSSNRGSRST